MLKSMRFAPLLLLLGTMPAMAERVVVPVAIYTAGANQSLWTTEIRATNHTTIDLAIHTIDYVDAADNLLLRFASGDYAVPAGQTRAFGAYNLLSPALAQCTGISCRVSVAWHYFGAYEIEVDAGISLDAAILTGSAPQSTYLPSFQPCSSWQGGYVSDDGYGSCVEGAGPLLRGSRGYFPPTTPVSLTWLHTNPTRRTNISLYNPDPVASDVTVTVTSADGTSSANVAIGLPAHSVTQLNDIFSSPPFDTIRAHNGTTTAAARATIVSTTRLYAIGWVISNQNNTVTISEPR